MQQQNIRVIGMDPVPGHTYMKRARQLVKNDRAVWVSRDTIRLVRQSREEEDLYTTSIDMSDTAAADNGRRDDTEFAGAPALDDKLLLEVAKRRLFTRKNLIGQGLDALLIGVVTLMFVGIYNADDRLLLAFFFCSFWGIRLAVRVFKFAKPSFKDGIAAYFRERRERSIETEYNRVKKMSADYVRDELKRS